ncbi:T9SS type A sorting domain-containing protein [Longibacter sp.]|uniref:T9SS type A sorting domain-containing protein n=1 Tax=Longibacter sp. TaxID=2045415 RepID=UPI003EB8DC1D
MKRRYVLLAGLLFFWVLGGSGSGIAWAQDGPGGVGNEDGTAGQPLNGLWLQADREAFSDPGCSTPAADADDVECWQSQSAYEESGGPVTLDPNGLSAPVFDDAVTGLNGRPALRFSRSADDGMTPEDLSPINSDGPYVSHQFHVAFRTGSDVTSQQVIYEEGGAINGLNLYVENGELIANAWSENEGWTPIDVRSTISANTSYVVAVVFDGNATDQLELYVNDAQSAVDTNSDPSVGQLAEHVGNITLGNVNNDTEFAGAVDGTGTGGFGFDGWIAGFAHFETATNDARRRIVMSAMAAKYDIAMTGQLYTFTGSSNRVAGTGTDVDGSTHFTAESEGLTLETTAAGTDEFTLVGHNGFPGAFTAETDVSGIGTRYERVWRIQKQGATSTSIVFDVTGIPLASGQEFRLLVESSAGSGTFPAGTSVLTGTLDAGNSTFSVAEADVSAISSGSYLTLARTEVSGPQSITYSPDAVTEAQDNLPVTSAIPSVTADAEITDFEIAGVNVNDANSNGLPVVTFGDSGSGSDLEIDPATGEITVTAGAPVGRYDINVRVTDEQAKDAVFNDVLTVTVTDELDIAYDTPEQVVNPGDPITTVAPEVRTEDAGASYSIVEDNLASFPGLSFDSSTGQLSGSTSATGLARIVVRGVGSGTATGDDTTEVHVAVVGGDGRAGVGDDVSKILDLEADTVALTDGDPVSSWLDASNYAQTVDARSGEEPTYRVNGIGGRPSLDFDGADDALVISDNAQINSGGDPYTGRTISVVFETGGDLTNRQVIYEEGASVRGVNLYIVGGDLYVGMWNLNTDDVDTTPWDPIYFSAGTSENGESTVTLAPNTAYAATIAYNAAAGRFEGYLNGTLIGSITDPNRVGRYYDHNEGVVGAQRDGGYYHDIDDTSGNTFEFSGQIASVVQYGVAVSTTQREILESAFADQYGLSVTPGYLATPFTAEEIVGVGQNGSEDPHDPVVTSSRLALRSPSLTAGQFAFLAHDDGPTSFALDRSLPDDYRGDGSTTTDDRVGSRFQRTWYVDRTNASNFDVSADISGLDPRTGQFVLLVDTDPTFTASAEVIEGTVNGTRVTFSNVASVFSGDDAYVTIGRTVGTESGITNLTYSPDPLEAENGSPSLITATPTFDGGDPIPEFTILEVREDGSPIATPSEFSLDINSGEFTADPSTSLQGSFEVDIQADNGEGTPAVYTLTVNIFELISTLTYTDPSQTSTLGTPVSIAVDEPVSAGIPGADYSYSVLRVSAFGTIQSDLTGTGLTLQPDGTLAGTLSQPGVVSVEVQVDASGGASGTETTFISASAIGSDGPGGMGDATNITVHLDPISLVDALEDGDPVASWADASAFGNDATQSNGGEQPVYRQRVGAVNDSPVLEFDGADDVFDLDDSQTINTKDVTLQRTETLVFRADDVTTRQVLYEEGAGTRGISLVLDGGNLIATAWNNADDDRVDGGEDATTPWEDASGGDGILSLATGVSTGTVYVATLTIDFVDGTMEFVVNGETVGSAPEAGRLYSHGGNIGLGGAADQYITGTSTRNGPDPFDGVLGDVLFHNVNLNATQRLILHNALGAQYGATILPASDLYAGEATEHDIDVVGVGRTSATDRHVSARRAGLVLDVDAGLNDGDFLIAGHDTRQNGASTADAVTGGAVTARMQRSWYVSRTEPSSSDLTVDVTFDLPETGVNAIPGDPSGYRLIHRPAGSASGTSWAIDGTSATVSGTEISFAGVSLADGDEYTLATTDRALSPINEATIVINGTPGTASTGRIGPDRGYRFIGPLVDGADASSLQFSDNSPFLQFPAPQGTIFYTWNETIDDPTRPGSQEGWWEAATSSTPLPPGRGALLYVLDDPTYAVDPSLAIHFDDALDPVSLDDDILVDNLNLGSEFHFLANSYPVPYDLEGLNTDIDGDSDGTADFKAVVQVFDATATSGVNEPTDNAVGFYLTKTADPAQPAPEREIAPGQGFFVERNDFVDDSGTRSEDLSFDAAFARTRLLETPGYIGSLSRTEGDRPTARKITLELAVRDGNGSLKSIDRAASVYFREGARADEDQFDASKLTPLSGRFALLGVEGPDRSGATRLWAQRSWPLPDETIEVPLQLHVSDVSGTASVRVHDWYQVPEDWTAVLIDTRGTSDPSDDVEHTMEPGDDAAYVFSLDTPTAAGKASDGQPQAVRPTFRRLEPHPQAEAAKSDVSVASRFLLQVYPSSDPLPVELANFSLKTDATDVVVEWTTAAEVNNDGFGIEYRRTRRADSTSIGGWTEAGYVRGNGTTDQANTYQFRVKDLDYGRHEVRLRQVDTDGQTAYSRAKSVDVRLTKPVDVGKPYPNPVRSRASLDVTVRDKQSVRIVLYDLLGRRVAVLHDGVLPANRTETIGLDTDGLASGQYFVRIRGDQFMETRRMTIVR